MRAVRPQSFCAAAWPGAARARPSAVVAKRVRAITAPKVRARVSPDNRSPTLTLFASRARASAPGSRTGPEACRPRQFHPTLRIDSGARDASTSAKGVVMELNLDQARRQAKELLRAARAGSPEALARFRDDRE